LVPNHVSQLEEYYASLISQLEKDDEEITAGMKTILRLRKQLSEKLEKKTCPSQNFNESKQV